MKPLLYNYIHELDTETRELLGKVNQPKHFINSYRLTTQALSPSSAEYLTLVSIKKAKWKNQSDIIRLNVRTLSGVNCITVQYRDIAVYQRYRAVLDRMRTTTVEVTFPFIEIHYSKCGLYFTSCDFKIRDSVPQPTILI